MRTFSKETHLDAIQFIESRESNAKTYARTFNRMMARGLGSSIWDVEGRKYLDCLACAGALPLGHNHPYVMARVEEFLRSGHVLQALDIPTIAKYEFLDQLMQCLPPHFAEHAKVQFCGPTGADAVEAAMKLFKTVTNRRSVFAFHGAYHGMTLGALGLMGNLGPKTAITGMASETHFFPYPQSARCPFGVGGKEGAELSLRYLESVLTDPESGVTKPSMVILEAVQGEGGCIPAPADWLREVRAITEHHDIPLVVDEVQTGFGRTGAMFAVEQSGIIPDAILMSKAIGGGFPLAVVAYHERYDKWKPGAHTGTFRGNQIAMVSGAATMQYIRESELCLQVEHLGEHFQHQLRKLADRTLCIGEIRGRGLMIGAEIVDPFGRLEKGKPTQLDGVLAREIKHKCFQRGLIIETGGRHGAVLRFLPPLVITKEEVDLAVQTLEDAIDEVARVKRAA